MFDSIADARSRLAAAFRPSQAEAIIEALAPTVMFCPASGSPQIGGTRIGGAPDLPSDLSWPRPSYAPDLAAAAARSGPDAEAALAEHRDAGLPCTFLAQIDLAAARALGEPTAGLPETGRLLFFHDLHLGPLDAGRDTARVIWDRTPREALIPRTTPDSLVAADAAYRGEVAAFCAEYGIAAPGADTGTRYGGPAQPMDLRSVLIPPEPGSLEMDDHPALQAACEDDARTLDSFIGYYFGLFVAYADDPHYGPAGKAVFHRLLGSPFSHDGRDPRLLAEAYARFSVPPVGDDQTALDEILDRDEVRTGARDWRLLLQINLGSFYQDRADGSVSFLLRASDLAEHRFDRVVAVV